MEGRKINMQTRAITIIHLLVVLIIMSTVNSVPVQVDSPEHIMSLSAANRAQKFWCKKPQIRAYNLLDLMIHYGYRVNAERPLRPCFVVVTRCDNHAGCCNSESKICRPDQNSTYFEQLEFDFLGLDSSNNSVIKKKIISVEHHFKCKCQHLSYQERDELENLRPIIRFV